MKQCKIIQTINERKIKVMLNKKDKKSVQGRTERIMASSGEGGGGGGVRFSNKNWEGGYNFTSKFFGGVQF